MIKAIFFDFGDVLADDGFRIAQKHLIKKTGLPEDTIKSAFLNSIWKDWDKGKVSSDAYWNEVTNLLGKKYAEFAHNHFLKYYKLRPQMISFALSLKNNFKVGILSNMIAEVRVFEEVRHKFDAAIFSFEIGLRKPDKEIYLFAAKEIGCKPEECLFIDDKIANLDGAVNAGFKAIEFNSYDNLVKTLKEMDIWKE